MEPTIYKPGAYNTPGIYKGAGGIYNGRGVYNDGAGEFVEIGGRKYPFVKIGSQFWTTLNLDWKYNGLNIGGSWVTDTPHAWYYDNDENLYSLDGNYKCGLIYNGYALEYIINNLNFPDNWRIPSLNDFIKLSNYIGNDNNFTKKLKAKDNSITTNFPSEWGGEDIYKLKIIPSGFCWQNFYSLNTKCQLWTSTNVTTGRNNSIYFRQTSRDLEYEQDGFDAAFSIRLVKDEI